MTERLLHPLVQASLERYSVEADVLECLPELADTAAFCEHYGIPLEQAANTIVVASRKVEPPVYAACVVLGTTRLDVNTKVRQLLGVKRLSFADAHTTRELTDMLIGGVTVFGIETMPVYVDAAVLSASRVVMGGGNRSSKLHLDPHELLKLPHAEVVDGLALPRDPDHTAETPSP